MHTSEVVVKPPTKMKAMTAVRKTMYNTRLILTILNVDGHNTLYSAQKFKAVERILAFATKT